MVRGLRFTGLIVFLLIASSKTSIAFELEAAQENFLAQSLIERIEKLKYEEPKEVLVQGKDLLARLVLQTDDVLKIKVDLLNQLSHAHIISGDYAYSLKYSSKAKLISESINYVVGQSIALKNIAHFYTFIDDYETALTHYLRAIELARFSGNDVELVKTINSVAQIYYKIGRSSESIELFNQSLDILAKSKDKRNTAYTYAGIAEAYLIKNSLDKSLEFASKALNIISQSRFKTDLLLVNALIGKIYLQRGNLNEASQSFKESIRLTKESDTSENLTGVYNYLAKIALLSDDFNEATSYANKALEIAQKSESLAIQSQSLQILSQTAKKNSQFKQSLDFTEQYLEIEKMIFNDKSDRNIAALRASFEVDTLERKNLLLEKQNELANVEIETQKIHQYFVILFSFFVIVLISFIYYRNYNTKKLEQEKMINEQLQHLNNMKDQILVNTSHEFRTPLAGIIGLADCLHEELLGPQSDEAKENLNIIINSGRRLTNLVEDIISFAQLRSGNIKLNLHPIDLYRPFEEVIKTCSILINEKPIQIVNTLHEKEFIAIADESRVSQILYNLIGNAIKYSEEGVIKVTAKQTKDFITVSVSDNGIGIPKDKYGVIFEYFEQIDGTNSRSHQGSGLGLAIVKQLVEIQGGSISVESKLNQGSIFSFTLPARKV